MREDRPELVGLLRAWKVVRYGRRVEGLCLRDPNTGPWGRGMLSMGSEWGREAGLGREWVRLVRGPFSHSLPRVLSPCRVSHSAEHGGHRVGPMWAPPSLTEGLTEGLPLDRSVP